MSDATSFAPRLDEPVPGPDERQSGPPPLFVSALSEMTTPITLVFVFSLVVNLLMLTGPLFMLQVYDRVLGSRSGETLVTLFALVCFLYTCLYLLDSIRGQVMIRLAARLRNKLEAPVLKAARASETRPDHWGPATALGELDTVQRVVGSPVALALFDLPWAPLYFGLLFVFHPLMGSLGLVATAVIVALAALKDYLTRNPLRLAATADALRMRLLQSTRDNGALQRMLGVEPGHDGRLLRQRDVSLAHHVNADERAWTFSSATRTFRLFLQSAMLALGAHLVLLEELTSGAMIAGSILLGRALMPLEIIIGNLSMLRVAIGGAAEMQAQLSRASRAALPSTDLTLPDAPVSLHVTNVSYKAADSTAAILSRVTFTVQPGEVLGVAGRVGSGKSRLARLVTGSEIPTVGEIKLGGIDVARLPADVLSRNVGFLPQFHMFFEGTLAENVARLDADASVEAVTQALERAGALDMVERLPHGMHTDMAAAEQAMSGTSLQRVGLARALFGDPNLLLLDEPLASLDVEGHWSIADVIAAQKARGKSVLVVTNRLKLLQGCDAILVLDSGAQKAFGPRERIMQLIARTPAAHAGEGPSTPSGGDDGTAAPSSRAAANGT